MSGDFLLPCECGQSVPIRLTQAGHTVRCTCNRELVVPTMREIRALPAAIERDTPLGTQPAWPIQYGILFAIGMGIAVAAAGSLLYFGWQRSKVMPYVRKPIVDDVEFQVSASELSPPEAWDIWTKYREVELGARRPPMYLLYRRRADTLETRMKMAAGLGALGLLVAVAAVQLGKRAGAPD